MPLFGSNTFENDSIKKKKRYCLIQQNSCFYHPLHCFTPPHSQAQVSLVTAHCQRVRHVALHDRRPVVGQLFQLPEQVHPAASGRIARLDDPHRAPVACVAPRAAWSGCAVIKPARDASTAPSRRGFPGKVHIAIPTCSFISDAHTSRFYWQNVWSREPGMYRTPGRQIISISYLRGLDISWQMDVLRSINVIYSG